MMDDPYKLLLPTIPHKTIAVHGTPRSASGVLLHAGVLPLPQMHYKFAATAAATTAWRQLGGSLAAAWRQLGGSLAAAEAEQT